jgi:hypothetical protein
MCFFSCNSTITLSPCKSFITWHLEHDSALDITVELPTAAPKDELLPPPVPVMTAEVAPVIASARAWKTRIGSTSNVA